MLVNKGRRTHALSWVTEGFSVSKLKKAEMQRKSGDIHDIGRKKQLIQLKDPSVKKPIFQIVPDTFILDPRQSCLVTITGYSDK